VRAAGRIGTVAILSTGANFSIEETAAVASGLLWFQLYILKDRGWTMDLVRRAEAAGFGAIVLTVDNVAGRLNSDQRKALYRTWNVEGSYPLLEPGRALKNFAHMPEEIRPRALIDNVDPAVTWADLDWLAGSTRLPVVVKGVQCSEDARHCVEHGAKALIVSNHGGAAPEMEGVRPTLEILPEVVAEVGAELEVYHDGGIRTGGDVLKALALGARAVLSGRPIQWGLAVDGEEGAFYVLQTLMRELDSIMGICGLRDIGSISPKVLSAVSTVPPVGQTQN
jgi:4-hydroxymandelate oxidase